MSVKTAAEVTLDDVGRYVQFKRPGDVQYGPPTVSGKLLGVEPWRNGSGREVVTLTVSSVGPMELSPRHPVRIGHVWVNRAEPATEYNIPANEDPILYAQLIGGPLNGKKPRIGGSGRFSNGREFLVLTPDGLWAAYEATELPPGVERPSSEAQQRHGYGPTVLVGTIPMRYQSERSDQLNRNRRDTPRT